MDCEPYEPQWKLARTVTTYNVRLRNGAPLDLKRFSMFVGATFVGRRVVFKKDQTFVLLNDNGFVHASSVTPRECDDLVDKLSRMADVCHSSDMIIDACGVKFSVGVVEVAFKINLVFLSAKNYRVFTFEPVIMPFAVGRIDDVRVVVATRKFVLSGDSRKFAHVERMVVALLEPDIFS